MDTALPEELATAANNYVAVAVEEYSDEVLGPDTPAVVNMALVVVVPDDVVLATAALEDATGQVSVEADDVEVVPVFGYHNSTTKLDLPTEVISVFGTMSVRLESAWQNLAAGSLAPRTLENMASLVLVWAI